MSSWPDGYIKLFAGTTVMSILERFIEQYKTLGVIALNTLFLFLLIEVFALTIETFRPGNDRALSSFEWAPWRLIKSKNPEDNSFVLNSDGFELQSFHIPPKIVGETRVVLLGGSTCVGYGVGDGSALNIDKALKEIAENAQSDNSFRFINLYQAGAVSFDEVVIFSLYGLSLKPDIVLLFNGANDIYATVPLGPNKKAGLPYMADQHMQRWHKSDTNFLVSLSQIFATTRVMRRILNKVAQLEDKQNAVENSDMHKTEIANTYLRSLTILNALGEANGFKVLVALQPVSIQKKPLAKEESERLSTLAATKFKNIGIQRYQTLKA